MKLVSQQQETSRDKQRFCNKFGKKWISLISLELFEEDRCEAGHKLV